MTSHNNTEDFNNLISKLKEIDAQISVNGNNLEIVLAKGLIDDNLKTLIRDNKKRLIAYIIENRGARKGSIDIIPESSSYALSSAQRRLWVLSQFEQGNVAYNMPGVYIFEGTLDVEALERSFSELISRHEILRTTFKEVEDGEPRQFVAPEEASGFTLTVGDLRGVEDQELQLRRLVASESSLAFDLSQGPLIRAGVHRLDEAKWLFTYTMHHIISDGWSMNILINEVLSLYNSYVKGGDNPLPSLPIQYKDYAVWQQSELSGSSLEGHKTYWLDQFSGELPMLELPTDRPRPVVKTYNGGSVNHRIPSVVSQNLMKLCQENGSTLFMGLLSAVNALLYRYTGQDDIIVGSPIAGRDHIDLEDQIGFYVNTLALRSRFDSSRGFREMLEEVREVTLGAFEHQAYPFDELVDELDLKRDISRNALFDVMVVLQNNDSGESEEKVLDGLTVQAYNETKHRTSKFDLSFEFVQIDQEIAMSIEYNTDIYDESSIERMAAHLESLIASAVADPAVSLDRLDYLGESERKQLLEGFNDTAVAYPRDETVISLFEQRVKETPDNIALVFEDISLTYRELNQEANRLSGYLVNHHQVVKEDLVGICLDRSEWMVICILAVLKSGGAYLPIDPDHPRERIEYMLEDSQCTVLLDQDELSRYREASLNFGIENPSLVSGPQDLAYVIYTSGSTGKPKGVMVEHGSVINLCFWHNKKFSINPEDRASIYAGVGFDASVWELFPYLIKGAS